MIHVVVVGAAGRMGRAIEAAAATAADIAIEARVDVRANFLADGGVWSDDVATVTKRGHVVVDFSGSAGARSAAAACKASGAALVTGSTGLSPEDEAVLRDAARHLPVLRASNFSLGLAALRAAVAAALGKVPGGWDVEIVERHHRLKKDSPSGTALTLAADVRAARELPDTSMRHGRQGLVGARSPGEIGMHAVRGGTWVGDHQVLLAGEGEWLELRHVVQDRSAFAHGALAAVRFVSTAAAGEYTLEDVLRAPGAHTR